MERRWLDDVDDGDGDDGETAYTCRALTLG